MSIPIYLPAAPGTCAYFDADGSFFLPEGRAEILSLDDRNPLPPPSEELVRLLLRAKGQVGAAFLYFDVTGHTDLIGSLSTLCPVIAPGALCGETAAIPIFSYQPERETFSAFLASIPTRECWLRLSPIDAVISYEDAGKEEQGEAYFSSLLQCNIKASHTETSAVLTLFDTKETFQNRFRLLSPRFSGVIGDFNYFS